MLNQDDILGYCHECKCLITINDDHMKDNGKIYCAYCYKSKNDIVEELNFDEETYLD
jgi:hypothetical protein